MLSHRSRSVGEVPERSIGAVSKTVVLLSVPRVRNPPSPPVTNFPKGPSGAVLVYGEIAGLFAHQRHHFTGEALQAGNTLDHRLSPEV